MISESVDDANELVWAAEDLELGEARPDAVALVAGQDIEAGDGTGGWQIARADHLTVFQRTPQYMIPARHGNVDKGVLDEIKKEYDAIYDKARHSTGGFPYDVQDRSALDVEDAERRRILEEGWEMGGFKFMFSTFSDLRTSLTASELQRLKDTWEAGP